MQTITTAEQDNLLSKLEIATDTVYAKYIDKSVMLQTIVIAMLKDLASGQSVRFVSGDPTMRQLFAELLEQLDLKSYAIDSDAYQHLDELAVSLLRSNAKAKSFTLPSHSAKYQLEHISQDIRESYQLLSDQIQTRIQVRDLPQILAAKARDKQTKGSTVRIEQILAVSHNLSHHELLALTSELASRYTPTHKELACGELLSAKAMGSLTGNTAIRETKELVTQYLAESDDLQQRYAKLANRYKNNFLNKIKSNQQQAEQYLREVLTKSYDVTDTPPTKGGTLSLFKKSKKQQTNPYQELALSAHSYLTNLDNSWSEHLSEDTIEDQASLLSYVADLQAANKEMGLQKQATYPQVAKHISLLNQEDEDWAMLSVRLNGLLHRLTTTELLAANFENNSQGLLQQIQLAEKVTYVLRRVQNRLQHHKDYYLLAAELAVSPLHQSIVDSLAFLPQQAWTTTVDKAYYDYYEAYYASVDLPADDTLLRAAHQHATTHFDQTIARVKSTIARQQRAVLAEIKTEHKLLYQSLVKKKLPQSGTSSELCTTYPAVAAGLFPIHISMSVPASNTARVYAVEYGGDTAGLRLSATVFRQEDFDNIGEEKNYVPLYLNYYQYSGKLDKLTHTEKIKAAKKLAKQLLSISQELKIYQLKSANIISVLPPQDDQYLESKLDALGAKVLHMDDVYLRLVESLLETGRPQHIVIKDGLIDAEHLDHFLYQYDVLTRCTDAGIGVQPIYTADQLLEGLRSPIDRLINEIVITEPTQTAPSEPNTSTDTVVPAAEAPTV